ncbi:MAG: alternative ribosome rescue aminoacyl-tRNA hydrolase ArfB [Acidobacteriota bacterium]
MQIGDQLTIDDGELEIRTSRASGPGGQHVNKTETRVTVRFDVANSPSLDEMTRAALLARLGRRLSVDGVLAVSRGSHRSQRRNRLAAEEELARLLAEALVDPKTRKATKVPRKAKRRRLDAKRRRSQVKAGRRAPRRDD